MLNHSRSRWLSSHATLKFGRLLVVGLPIGNIGDISLRAAQVLSKAELIFAEDTRVTRAMLAKVYRAFGLERRDSTRVLRCDEHTFTKASKQCIDWMRAGRTACLVSDAGTPAISDPGGAVVRAVIADGHAVSPIPGASAVIAAMSIAGDARAPREGFQFSGFVPRK